MRGGKQLPCARVDRQAGNRDYWQTRCRHRPTIGRACASKPDNAEVGRRIKVTRDIVVSDAVNRLVPDRRSGALKVHPGSRICVRVVRYREDVTGSDRAIAGRIRLELVVA